jgi:hypothetical protein
LPGLFPNFFREFSGLSKDFKITFSLLSAARWASDVEDGSSAAALILVKADV